MCQSNAFNVFCPYFNPSTSSLFLTAVGLNWVAFLINPRKAHIRQLHAAMVDLGQLKHKHTDSALDLQTLLLSSWSFGCKHAVRQEPMDPAKHFLTLLISSCHLLLSSCTNSLAQLDWRRCRPLQTWYLFSLCVSQRPKHVSLGERPGLLLRLWSCDEVACCYLSLVGLTE